MPYNGKQKFNTKVASLDEVADSLTKPPAAGEKAELFRWQGHEDVYVLRFPSNGAQKAGMARLSVFLEDSEYKGTVVAALPSGRVGGAAAYSGHNARASDVAAFFSQAKQEGIRLEPAEEELRALLEQHGVLVPTPGGLQGAPGACVLSVARGFAPGEARECLLHEAMHGLFYASKEYERECWRFWRERLSPQQRNAWLEALGTLGYDAGNEELAVNEFQAYMATERKLWGGGDAAAGGGGGGAKGKKGGGGGGGGAKKKGDAGGGGDDAQRAALEAMQRLFNCHIAPFVPTPHPQLASCACLFAGFALPTPGKGGGAGGRG